ncbi:hypothetical protein FZEAL_3764 [Fusarium zealandicum]|uniref:Glutathione S-transferase UstS-like C-terminal domain-containing protein n=1 Tax=Fusarium zealandicum TaxID=1053134 RepID=A0A8H4UNP0_9HYPO|nr:hypothetical protein FZEAL_3764 [Fusarium zealandicum]
MSSDQITLYDLPSKPPCAAWSLNPWKTRIPQHQARIGAPVRPQLASYGLLLTTHDNSVSANPSTGTWTIPTVKFPDGAYIMDSLQIVQRIEKEHPEPSVHLDSPALAKLGDIMPRLMGPLRPIYFTNVPEQLLNQESIAYWHETRSKLAGMPLDKFSEEQGGQKAWDAAKPALHEVEALIRENPDGPFFLGKTPSYADFQWAGLLIFLQRNGVIEELYKISGDSHLHKDLLEATAPWAKRNDH